MVVCQTESVVAGGADEVRLVLCMNVKNEARILGRCLDSALPHVDGYVICDTGSSDDTVRVIAETAERLGRPGRVVRHAWRDFGHNRTLSAREARAWVSEQGWPTARTYLLFLDADMVLQVEPGFDKRRLDATYYMVVQDSGALRYFNVRLACLSHDWVAIGATHEYWQTTGDGAREGRLDTMWIRDIGDGGSKSNKLVRDIRLLRTGLAQAPNDPRHVFYLAQTYFDAGNWAESAQWYARRWQMGGWAEERWYARYRWGLCLLRLGQGERGCGVLIEAFDERPTRAEPLWALAQHYRVHGKNHAAMLMAVKGLAIPFPKDDVLFVERRVYDWQLWEEVMICAFYVDASYRELGFSACERLLTRRDHDAEFYNYVAGTEVFYVQPVTATRRGVFAVPPEVRDQEGIEFYCANPTIARRGDSTYVNVRLLNYQQKGGRIYRTSSGDDVFRSRNAAIAWDPATGSGPAWEIRGLPDAWPANTQKRGLEDVRFVEHRGEMWFTATCYQIPDAQDVCRVVVGRLNRALDVVEHLVGLRYHAARNVEKNWVLWSRADGLFLIYSYDPFVVLRFDPDSGETEQEQVRTPAWRAAGYRGSGAPIPIPERDGRFLAMVHEVAYRPSGNVYFHRWVEIDERDGVVSYSRPFVFDHTGIEYGTGLCDLGNGHVIVTYGHEDSEARWVEVAWNTILTSLRVGEGQYAPRSD
ncbi:MAG TPA: glycosyltransferase family 2 protein [Kofleriaceae bacterium]